MRRKNNFVTYPETKEAGVYAIVNKTRKKVYIGESQNIRSRAKAHINLLKSGKHYCEELQKDYDNNHKMEIVEVYIVSNSYDCDTRLCMEDFYIACLQQKGIELYNNPRDKNCKDNFFIYASRLDKNVYNIYLKWLIISKKP